MMFDPRYYRWLQLNHPESVPTQSQNAITPTAVPSPQGTSLVQHFSHVTPLTPVATKDQSKASSSGKSHLSPQSCRGSKAVSKYLVPPATSTPSGHKTGLPRACLLTSAAALQLLEEKEQKQKEQEQLKQQKKKEREENKLKEGRRT